MNSLNPMYDYEAIKHFSPKTVEKELLLTINGLYDNLTKKLQFSTVSETRCYFLGILITGGAKINDAIMIEAIETKDEKVCELLSFQVYGQRIPPFIITKTRLLGCPHHKGAIRSCRCYKIQ